MPVAITNELRDALGLGLGAITPIWDYKARDWPSSVSAVDINNDGVVEIVASSRDGRVYLLSATGDLIWESVVGAKTWVGTVVAVAPLKVDGEDIPARIIVGTRDGKIYVLDKDGQTVSKDGQAFAIDENGRAVDPAQEQKAYWYNTGYVIRQIYTDPNCPTTIVFGSEDRCVYVLDYKTGELIWKYRTKGWVRAVCSCDINGDGKAEILAGSVDKYLYVFDEQGQLLTQYYMGQPVQRIFAADIDKDENIEILVGTDGKDLVALSYRREEGASYGRIQKKWRALLDNRVLSVYVTDLDNDGRSEIVVGSEDKHIYILDEHGKTIWQHNHKFRIFSLYPYDIDNDNIPELLVASENDRVLAMRVRLHRGLMRKIRNSSRRLKESQSNFPGNLTIPERDLLQDIVGMEEKEQISLKSAEHLMETGDYSHALLMLLKLQQIKVELLGHKDDVGNLRKVSLRHRADDLGCEIIASNTEGVVTAFDESGHSIWSVKIDDHIVDMQIGFFDQSGQESIVVCSDHHLYILGGAKKQTKQDIAIDAWMSSVCVTTPDKQGVVEIIAGSEGNKLYTIRDTQQTPEIINTPEGIRAICAPVSRKSDEPGIIAAGLGNHAYALTRSGDILWDYETRDRIPAVYAVDLNRDSNVEVLVGSEDRNIHVLDKAGHLLWRYYLPHSVLAFDVADIDHDGRMEIVVGCADGYLHVLNCEGDPLWNYAIGDRIHALRIGDIDGDRNLEIAVGSEDELNLLRVVNQQHLSSLIDQCWTALNSVQPVPKLIDALQRDAPFVRAFRLRKFAEQQLSERDFDIFDRFVKDESVQVRMALVDIVTAHYVENKVKALQILLQLSMDNDLDVKSSFIEDISVLTKDDWELALRYLNSFIAHSDRHVRRMVARKLYQMVDALIERTAIERREIFDLLLLAIQDKESEWVRQEAARSLAHFLDRFPEGLVINIHLLAVNKIQIRVFQHIEHTVVTPFIKSYVNAAIHLLSGLNNENVFERVQEIVNALEEASGVESSQSLYTLYAELRNLLTFHSISEIAEYEPTLRENQFDADDEFARIILNVFRELSFISRLLRIYLRRDELTDRLASLLQAIEAMDTMSENLEKLFSEPKMDIPITKLPDHQMFMLLLQRWRAVVLEKLNELRGKAEIEVELRDRQLHYENQVGIRLTVRNEGRSSASNMAITLLPGSNFLVEGESLKTIDLIPPREEKIVEFNVDPRIENSQNQDPQTLKLDLSFQIVYDDAEQDKKPLEFHDYLQLSESFREFVFIPNPYSTGTPTHDSKMFYGREADVVFLQDNLTRDVKTVIVLFGQRRSGKTTLLLQVLNQSAFGEHIPVLIDMQRFSYNISIQRFLYKMAQAICLAMTKNQLQVCEPVAGAFEADPTGAFDDFLNKVEEQLHDRKLILLVDEFEVLEEQVLKGKLDSEIFEYLRNILQLRKNINFLFSGTHKITEYTKWYSSVFFNIARHYRLSRISPAGAEALIQKPVAGYLDYEPLALTKIRELTGDQPYLIQLLCRTIVDYCNERRKTYVTINDVNMVLREVMQTIYFHFDWLWDKISPEERVVLAILAKDSTEEGSWLILDEIVELYQHNHINFKREHLVSSLKSLVEADIIEATSRVYTAFDNNKFRIPAGLIRRWILGDKPLEQVRKELGG